jgi:monofunctional biosynthetic peptidoglycan transglycosylase
VATRAAPSVRSRSLFGRVFGTLLKLVFAVLGLGLLLSLAALVVTPPSTLMLGRWATGQPVERSSVPLASISPYLPAAVIASEDARFCLHHGVDWDALRDVIDDEDGPSRGASTVTMQTAKNVFLWPSRSYVRKALEIPLALYLDLVWGKRRTIEIYLNIAEWGDGIFGAEAAAQHHFGKPARDLSRQEAALLATTLPNPHLRNPARPSRGQRAHAGTVMARMLQTPTGCFAR